MFVILMSTILKEENSWILDVPIQKQPIFQKKRANYQKKSTAFSLALAYLDPIRTIDCCYFYPTNLFTTCFYSGRCFTKRTRNDLFRHDLCFFGRLIPTNRHRFVRYFFLTESGDIRQKLATLINRILFLWLSDCCDVSKSLEKLGQYLVSHWELSHWLACAPPSPDKNLPTLWNRQNDFLVSFLATLCFSDGPFAETFKKKNQASTQIMIDHYS